MSTILTLFIFVSLLGIIVGIQFYITIYLFYKGEKKNRDKVNETVDDFYLDFNENNLPFVTIQLPVYNESEIIKRLILSATEIDYPADKFEIQVVDDSTDDTVSIIDKHIARLKSDKQVNIYTVRRTSRKHFKAGALANALKYAKGEYVAIFDADFIIPKHFLKRTIPQIHNKSNIACIQARWGHINRYESWLTKGTSVALDALIASTQAAKSYSSTCPTFCGTAGIIRISSINSVGGWSGDTLTEDQCLSFRMHAAGYKIILDFDLICYAELPNNIMAFKSQQRRWVKGGVQTLIKLLPTILRSKNLSPFQKFAILSTMASNLATSLPVIGSILLLPLIISNYGIALPILWSLLFITGILGVLVLYIGSGYSQKVTFFSFRYIPVALMLFAGTSVSSTIGCIEALLGIKSDFIRTPKSGSSNTLKSKSKYTISNSLMSGIIESLIGIICIINIILILLGSGYSKYFFAFFLTIYAIGVCMFGFTTLKCALIQKNSH